MKDNRDEQWRERAWRQGLSPADRERVRDWLRAHPEVREEWVMERLLTGALGRLPDAAVPSNFAARVAAEIARVDAAAARGQAAGWFAWRRRPIWLPRLGFAALLLGTGFFSYRHQVLAEQRAAMVRSVVTVSEVAPLPGPRILKDFEAIRAMDQTPPDVDLLRLLK